MIGKYRKIHLFDIEQLFFEPGIGTTGVSTPIGKIGLLICYDLWFPSSSYFDAQGADIVVLPLIGLQLPRTELG